MLLVLWPPFLKHGIPRFRLLVLWHHTTTRGLLELGFSLCGHHTSKMPSSNYAPRFVTTIPQTWHSSIYTPSCVAIIPQTMASSRYAATKEGVFEGHHSTNMASSSYAPRFEATIPQNEGLIELYSSLCGIIPQTMSITRVMLLVLWPSYLKHGLTRVMLLVFVDTIPQTMRPVWGILLILWPSYLTQELTRVILMFFEPSYLKHGLLELCSSLCGHHSSNTASSNYAPRLWPPFLKHGFLDLYSFLCGHHTTNMAPSSYASLCGHHSSNMASSSYAPRFVATIPQTRASWVILLAFWWSLKLGPLELCSSCLAIIPQTWHHRVMLLVWGHVDTIPRGTWTPWVILLFVAIIPQTWSPRNILLVLWPPFLKHGFLDLYSFFCGHHTSNIFFFFYLFFNSQDFTIPCTLPPD